MTLVLACGVPTLGTTNGSANTLTEDPDIRIRIFRSVLSVLFGYPNYPDIRLSRNYGWYIGLYKPYIKSRGSDSRQIHYLPYRHWSVGGVRESPHGRGVTLSIFSYMKNPSRLEARWTNPPAALVVTCSVRSMHAVVPCILHPIYYVACIIRVLWKIVYILRL